MTESEKREFDHLVNGIRHILKEYDETPPHGRFSLPAFQPESVRLLLNQFDISQLKQLAQSELLDHAIKLGEALSLTLDESRAETVRVKSMLDTIMAPMKTNEEGQQ